MSCFQGFEPRMRPGFTTKLARAALGWKRSRRLPLPSLEQLSSVSDSKARIDPHTKERTLPTTPKLPALTNLDVVGE
jgi:hypothetical protein